MKHLKRKPLSFWLCLGGLLLAAALVLSLLMPSRDLSAGELFAALRTGDRTGLAGRILFGVRFPRAAACVLCGIGLSLSGLLLQASLNNSLMAPGIVGINAGAGLFVLISGLLFPGVVLAKSVFSFLGAFFAVLLVYAIAVFAGVSKTSLILAGLAVSYLFNAVTYMLITWRPELVSDKASFTLGGFSQVSGASVRFILPILILGLVITFLLSPGIDLFLLGDETAAGLGLPVNAVRMGCLFAATLLAGASVALCGLLGFVGLIIPNLVRLLSGSRFRVNAVLCVLFGPAFVLLCDTAARGIFYPYELPAGMILSVIGTPFFIAVLIRRRKKLSV